jgi:hypothetical protein
MLQQGLPPDSADYDGRTALMLAAGHGHLEAVKLLLAAGADPSRTDALQVGGRGGDVLAAGGSACLLEGEKHLEPSTPGRPTPCLLWEGWMGGAPDPEPLSSQARRVRPSGLRTDLGPRTGRPDLRRNPPLTRAAR